MCRSETALVHRPSAVSPVAEIRFVRGRGGAYIPPVATSRKVRQRILSGRSEASIRFDDLRLFLLQLGFAERVRGSHHVFRREGVPELINLQRSGSQAKP